MEEDDNFAEEYDKFEEDEVPQEKNTKGKSHVSYRGEQSRLFNFGIGQDIFNLWEFLGQGGTKQNML